jgi:hypothetical protein
MARSRQGQLMQILGSTGSTVDSTHYGFVLVAATVPASDDYQAYTTGERSAGFNNITITGSSNSRSWNIDGTPASCSMTAAPYCNSGMLFQNPTLRESTDVNAVLQNLQVVNFPGHGISANDFNGEFRGYNVYAGQSVGNCLDIENKGNPSRFYGLTATGCTYGINLASTAGGDFLGAVAFGNDINLYVSGTTRQSQAFIVFDDLHVNNSKHENMYVDQQNVTVICNSNCTFGSMNSSGDGGDGGSSVVVGPDAVATDNPAGTVLRLNQGFIKPDPGGSYKDIVFDTNGNGETCKCNVALGDGMLNVAGTGAISSNMPAQVTGPIYFGGPATGAPLQLNANEVGLATSFDTAVAPNKFGLKFRVQCGTISGTAQIVVLAGTSSAPISLLDNIGTGVNGC